MRHDLPRPSSRGFPRAAARLARDRSAALLLTLLGSSALLSPVYADQLIAGRVQAGEVGNQGRITFFTQEDVPGQAIMGDNSIMVHFVRPVAIDVGAIAARLPHYVTGVERSGDDYIIHTTGKVGLHAFSEDRSLVLDLSGASKSRPVSNADTLNDSEFLSLQQGGARPVPNSNILPAGTATATKPAATDRSAVAEIKSRGTAPDAAKVPPSPAGPAVKLAQGKASDQGKTPDQGRGPEQPGPDVKDPKNVAAAAKSGAVAAPGTNDAAGAASQTPDNAGTLWLQIRGGFGLDRLRLGSTTGALAATLQRTGNDVQITFDRPVTIAPHALDGLPSTIRDPVLESVKPGSVLHLNVGDSARTFLSRQGRSYLLEVFQLPAAKPSTAADLVAQAPRTPAPVPAPVPAPARPAQAPDPALARRTPPSPGPAGADTIARPAGPLIVRYLTGQDGGSLRFDWQRPVSAALFRRGGMLWVVFDTATPVNLDGLRAAFPRAEQLPSPDATVIRLPLAATQSPSPRRSGNSWIVDLRTQPMRAESPVELRVVDHGGKRVQLPALEPSPPLMIIDPDAGDRLVVVPLASLGQGMDGGRHFVEFDLLASAQGLAVVPLADGLDVRSLPQAVDISVPGGLTISSDGERQARLRPAPTPSRFALDAWRGDAGKAYTERRQAKLAAVAEASPAERTTARMALARFYFANGFATEALGLLDAVRSDDPAVLASPGTRALHGASLAYSGDAVGARQELSSPELADDPDAALWRASAFATEKNWQKANVEFGRGLGVIEPYPPSMRHRLLLQAARAAFETGDQATAQDRAKAVLDDDPTVSERQEAEYVTGLSLQAANDVPGAVEHWNVAAAGENGPSQVRASLDRTMALVKLGKMTRPDGIATLEKLRYSWRGDSFELDLLRQLGRLQVDDGDIRAGLVTWRSAVSAFPDRPEAKQIAADMVSTFTAVFAGDKARDVSPLKAVALYDEFRELTPNGPVGDQVIRDLADRLVKVDLLDRAGNLLDYQAKYRLSGKDRVRVASQLALVRLLDHKPDAAIAALDLDPAKDVPPDLARQRQELRGRALLELGRPAEALAILNGDSSDDADRLRADVYWRTQNWSEVAKLLPKLIGPVNGDKLSPTASRTVLSLATALELGKDQAGLAQLRQQYGKAMENGPDRQAFRIVAGTSDGMPTDYHALAGVVAQTGDFTGFLASYRDKLGSGALSAIN